MEYAASRRLFSAQRPVLTTTALVALAAFCVSRAAADTVANGPDVTPASLAAASCPTGSVAEDFGAASGGLASGARTGSIDGSQYTVALTVTESSGQAARKFDFAITTSGTTVYAKHVVARAVSRVNVYDYGAGIDHDDGLAAPDGRPLESVSVCVAQMAQSLAVTFRSLSASKVRGNVVLRWKTASEIDTLGYNVYREVNGKKVKLNRRVISSKGVTGGSYAYRYRVPKGTKAPARFWLEVINLDGSRTWRSVRA